MTHDVFICHSSKDRTIANAICSTLEQHKIRCWIAPRDVLPGSEYAGSIVAAITASKLTILVFSSNSNDSQHVRREIERSVSHGLPVLPFRVEDVVPHPSLEYFISGAHWLDAMTPPIEQHLDHLVGTVQLLLEREAATAAGVSDASAAAASAAAASPTRASTPITPIPPPLPADRAPGAGATVGGARPTRRRPSTAVITAIGAVAIVALAVGAFFLSGGGRPGASQAVALPSASPTPTVTPAPTSNPTPAPGSTVAAGSAIAQITAALPTSLACDPPETPSAESIELATVFCYVGDATVAFVHYTLYPNVSALRNDYGSWLDFYELALGTSGSCANGDRMEDAWSFKSTPSITEGHYFCVVDDENQANLYWTDEASLILVDLAGDTDVTLDKLYVIWREGTYDPVRP